MYEPRLKWSVQTGYFHGIEGACRVDYHCLFQMIL